MKCNGKENRCENEARPERKLCQSCAAQMGQANGRYYARRKELGLCVNGCGAFVEIGHVLCLSCRTRRAARAKERYAAKIAKSARTLT